jgi:HK97 family phage major capsid protein
MDAKSLIEKRDALLDEVETVEELAASEKRALTEDEKATVDARLDEVREIKATLERLAERAELREVEGVARLIGGTERAAAPAAPKVETKARPVYSANDSSRSWFADAASFRMHGDMDALQRMQAQHEADADKIEKRDLYINAGNGGELSPPLYLNELFVQGRIANDVAAQLATRVSLDGYQGQSVTVPKITGNTGVGVQTEASTLNALTETDATTGAATESIKAIGGVQDISGLLTRRSFPGADAVIVQNLARQVAAKKDALILDASSDPQSIDGASGINAVTYTASTPTFALLYAKLNDAIQQIHSGWLEAPTAIVMHPRRVADLRNALDTTNRPLVSPMDVAMNPLAHFAGDGKPVAQGFTGLSVAGLPVYADANVPTTVGAGTNQDIIYIAKWDQLILFESSVMLDVSREATFKQDGTTVRAVQDVSWVVEHAPEAFATINGTGLVAPSF